MLAAALVTDGTAVSILYFLLSPNPNEACPISRYGVPSLQPMPRENPMSGWLTVLKVSNHCVLRRGKSVVWAKDKKVIYSTTIRWLALAVRLGPHQSAHALERYTQIGSVCGRVD